MGHNATGLIFSIPIICKSSKLSLYSLLKNMSKIPISDKFPISNFALFQKPANLVSQGLTF